ncbi:unnamed protein product [Dicrocoelium dendriticum]|nr:unnamed protein product [Dicrocoelium dendriticum]
MKEANLVGQRSIDKLSFTSDNSKNGYEESLYLLNRCLNDIEWFGSKLSKYLTGCSDTSRSLSDGSERILPPHRDELIECIRKIKYAFNLNQDLESILLKNADKVYVRLIKLVRWLDQICQNRLVPDYPQNLVRRVVEPPLSESSIEAVIARLAPETGTFWTNLGDAWNLSSTNWQNPLPTYVPHFKTMPRKQLFSVSPKQLLQASPINVNSEQVSQGTLTDGSKPNKSIKVAYKVSSPRIRNSDHERYYQKIQDRGGRLCFATVDHMKAVANELSAKQGDLFEILDDTSREWWKVENYGGEIGLVPKWKLRPFRLTASSHISHVSPHSSPAIQPGTSVSGEHNSAFQTQRWDVDPISTNKPVTSSSFVSPFAAGSQYDDISLSNLTPLVVYIPREVDRLVSEQKQSNPLLLMPYGQKQESKSRFKPDSHSPTTMTPPTAFEKSSKLPSFCHSSGQPWSKYGHPHSPVACKPTILLETKQRSRF